MFFFFETGCVRLTTWCVVKVKSNIYKWDPPFKDPSIQVVASSCLPVVALNSSPNKVISIVELKENVTKTLINNGSSINLFIVHNEVHILVILTVH